MDYVNNSDFDSDDVLSITKEPKCKIFYETHVMHCTDDEFENEFRMKRSTVQALIACLVDNDNARASIMPFDKKIHVYLKLLTSNSSFAEIGALYGLHKSSISYIFNEISSMLEDLKDNFISWPSIEDQQITRLKVYSRYRFPNCVGFIDAMRFKIFDLKSTNESSHVSLQAVCNESYMFTDVFVGTVGVVRKSEVFKSSPLSKELQNFIDFDNHLLGSSAYKLHNNLIKPYTSDEIVTSGEMKYNEVHTNIHRHIKDAFRILLDRFKRLGNIDMKADTVKTMIYATCVLHNFVLLHERVLDIKEEAVSNDYKEVFEKEFMDYVNNSDDVLSITKEPKCKIFYETHVMHCTDDEFENEFRMKRSTVQALIACLVDNDNARASIMPFDIKIHVYLKMLTSNSSFAEIGALYGLHKSSISYIFKEISSMLEDLKYNFISWPSIEDQQITRLKVYSRYRFPNCVGFIDAKRFKIFDLKSTNESSHLLLQAVCNESYMFTDVFVGTVGVVRKSEVFKSSPLSKELQNFIDFDNHLLGSSEYKLHNNLIKPYTSDEIVTSGEMKYNEVHTNIHRHIKDAFRILLDRFKRLGNIDMKADTVKTMIYATCVLHNFVLLHERVPDIKEEAVSNDYKEVFEKEFMDYVNNSDDVLSITKEPKCKIFYETHVMHCTDDEFENEFRMKRSTVQALIACLVDNDNARASIMPFDKKIHVYLSLLTSNSSFAEIGALYGLHKSSISYIFNEISSMLEDLKHNFISWPSIEHQQITRLKVYSRYRFPNCVGFIDAMRFKIFDLKSTNKLSHVLLQAVCNESYMFTDVFVGKVGVVRKSEVFKSSPLSKELQNFIDFDNHLLGSSEYKLHNNLITPYEIVTSEKMKYNEVHTNTHRYIKDAFRILLDRFKRLGNIDMKADTVKTMIYATCVLHNFVLLHEGVPGIKEEAVSYDEAVTIIDSEVVKNAMEKREFLCNYINVMIICEVISV